MIPTWKNWQYKNTTLLVLSLVLFFYFIEVPALQKFIKTIGSLGYLGSFITGILFVSTFTVAPASAILFDIAKILNPYLAALCAGLGAVVGDYILFRYLQDRVFKELKPLFEKHGRSIFGFIFATPFFAWLIPIIGAIIIASPFPDEVGISLMGLSRIKKWQFILITFLLNSIGIFVIITIANAVRN
jgi:hypothetical protein